MGGSVVAANFRSGVGQIAPTCWRHVARFVRAHDVGDSREMPFASYVFARSTSHGMEPTLLALDATGYPTTMLPAVACQPWPT